MSLAELVAYYVHGSGICQTRIREFLRHREYCICAYIYMMYVTFVESDSRSLVKYLTTRLSFFLYKAMLYPFVVACPFLTQS